MKKIFILTFLFYLSFAQILQAQVTTIPEFPTADEPVTIIYDATLGTSGLVGASSVHIHTGVILSGPDGTGWENTVGEWGNPASPGEMTQVSGETDKWEITFTPRDYYGIADGVTIYRLGMVFRESGPCGGFDGNATPCAEGKDENNNDIYVDLFLPGLNISITEPTETNFFSDINVPISISANASETADMTIEVNGTEIASEMDVTSISTDYTPTMTGAFEVVITADNGTENTSESFNFIVAPNTVIEAIPSGIVNGINYDDSDPTKATLVLNTGLANAKDKIFILGDFNDWQIDLDYQMKKDSDNKRFWLEIDGLAAGTEYAFQYLIDGEQRLADPFADKILDPNDDQFISTTTYPDLKPYPTGETTGIVSILQTDQTPYSWTVTDFTRPDKSDLVIYELLVRDFDVERNFQDVIDRLDYLEDLGINALQLMPIGEFAGNISWGYNPNFFFAVDKAYGTRNKLKELIDECHARGMAVIIDVVLNHAHETFPYMSMYSEGFQATAENPWFNVNARHPFNVFNDFNHDSNETKALLDTFNLYWLREYKIDGFRFDLSKGFTQNNDCGGSDSDVGCWNARDQSRIDNLTRMSDVIWGEDSDAYVILEHLANNDEETELANYGMMLWGNMHGAYKEASLGFNSSLNGTYHSSRGWNDPHLVAYMESHDEQRLMYDNLNFGNSNGDYDIKELNTALDRIKLASSFFYTIPGPKMLWQFGELGYDFPINYCPDGTIQEGCRTDIKPIRWDYFDDTDRRKLYDVYSSLIKLKTENEVFKNGNYTLNEAGFNNFERQITLTHGSMNVVVLGNFDVVSRTFNINFPNTGSWYDYFSDDRVEVTGSTTMSFTLEPGQFHILTSNEISLPDNVGEDLVPFLLPNRVLATPDAPSGLTATLAGDNSNITLNWTDNADNESGFIVERSIGNNTSFTELVELGANIESYEDTDLASGEVQYYRVKAINVDGTSSTESSYSNEANATVPDLKPNAPTNLTATLSTSGSVNLSWTDNADNETRYVVERSVSDNTNFTTLIQLGINSTTYADAGVSGNQTYFYRVKAVIEDGGNTFDSDYSNEANIVVTSLESNRFAQSINTYPNPTQNDFVLTYSNSYQGKVKLNIVDAKGQVIREITLNKQTFKLEEVLSIKDLDMGLYFIEIEQTDGQKGIKRLIKE